MTKQTWQAIYAAGEQLNRYPYDFIVSSFFRFRPQRAGDRPPRVLDLGCGAGNHALFFAENGAEVVAVDYSTAALEVLAERARERGLDDRIRWRQADFEDFRLDEDGFDMAIDRLAVSHVSRRHAADIYARVHEMMNDGGILLASLFSTGHSHRNYGRYDADADVWQNFSAGIFEHLETACFYNEAQVRKLLADWSIQSLVLETQKNILSGDQKEMWNIIAEK